MMDKERRRSWLGAGTALAGGLLLRLWFVTHLALLSGDTLIYGGIAKNLLMHGVYGFSANDDGSIAPTLIRLPGYPLFLAACFRLFGIEHYRAVMYLQIAADLLTCWLAGALAGRLFGRRAALVVLWIAALCPFTAAYTAAPLTETLTLSTIALTFYGFARWQEGGLGFNRWLWGIAAGLGASILLRPEQGLFAAAVLPAMLWKCVRTAPSASGRTRRAAQVVVAALCAVLPLAPWTLRNWKTFHVFEPLAPRYANDPNETPPVGFGRWFRSWAIDYASTEDIYWNYDGNVIDVEKLPERAFEMGSLQETAEMRRRTAAVLDDYNQTMTVTADIDGRFAALAAERVRAHPVLYYADLPVARLADMILRPRLETLGIALDWWRWHEHRAQTAFAAAYGTLNFAYLIAGFGGFVVWRLAWKQNASYPYRELAWAMAASIVLRCLLLLTIDNSETRYTLEFFPALFVWTGAWFASRAEANVSGEQGAGATVRATSTGRAAARNG